MIQKCQVRCPYVGYCTLVTDLKGLSETPLCWVLLVITDSGGLSEVPLCWVLQLNYWFERVKLYCTLITRLCTLIFDSTMLSETPLCWVLLLITHLEGSMEVPLCWVLHLNYWFERVNWGYCRAMVNNYTCTCC